MPDALFSDPRLAPLYDVLEGGRPDLEPYLAMAGEFGARRVLDIGCGTGVLALLLAGRGLEVTGVDPALASLEVARAKPGAERVRWIHGDAGAVPSLAADLAVMTGNAAQAVIGPADWERTLRGAFEALRPGGRLVFETRDPGRRAWEEWDREHTHTVTDVPGTGPVENWIDLLGVDGPLVTFRAAYLFRASGETLYSHSTLCFRERDEVTADLTEYGFSPEEVREAPDRPGRELVFVARRPEDGRRRSTPVDGGSTA
ncbi:class I SAM-dependent methyltransferase [Streptomyces sp. NPDC093252]|uniref:class I SAM-dependent DNA methyltransferase n=1 Tax=Streptomyces sp. NPDC093252 TaxID=3154980 RepID=UPI0034445F2A